MVRWIHYFFVCIQYGTKYGSRFLISISIVGHKTVFPNAQKCCSGCKFMVGLLSWALGVEQFSVEAASTCLQFTINTVSSTCKPGIPGPPNNLHVAAFLPLVWTLIFSPLLKVLNIAQENNFDLWSFYLCLKKWHRWYSDYTVDWTIKELWCNSWQA